jgi:hypothetical protein
MSDCNLIPLFGSNTVKGAAYGNGLKQLYLPCCETSKESLRPERGRHNSLEYYLSHASSRCAGRYLTGQVSLPI